MISVLAVANNLNKSDDIESLILEYIDSNIDSVDDVYYPLTEAIGMFPELSTYSVLIESVNEIKKTEKEINEAKGEKDPEKKIKFIDKIIQSVKNLFNWWYKIEPDKKFKTLHTILKILVKVIALIILIYYPEKALLTKGIAARLPIGYEGSNKILQILISKKVIAATIVRSIINQIYKVIGSLNKKAEFSANIKDIEKSIAEYDKAIDEINKLLEETGDPQIKMNLEKTKKDLEDTLRLLIKIKEDYDKESEKKNNKKNNSDKKKYY